MRVLALGTDRKLFENGSGVRMRQHGYAERFGSLDIIVFSSGAEKEVVEGPLRIIPTKSLGKLFYGFDAWRLAKTLSKPDIVTSQDPFETGLAAWWTARSLGAPLHIQVHTDFTSPEFARASLSNWLRQRIAWFVLRRAAGIRTVLQRTMDDIRARGIGVPISVLPIFTDLEKLSRVPRIKHSRWKIALLAAGRLEKEKRFDIAIRSLAAARTGGHDAGLTIVGSGKEESSLRSLARRLRVEDRVEFVGWEKDLSRYFATADIVLVPSRFEGYGLVIVEALAAGVPVLATDVGVAREAGAIVASANEFPRALLRWIENGPRQASLAHVPYRDIEEYIEKYCKDIERCAKPE